MKADGKFEYINSPNQKPRIARLMVNAKAVLERTRALLQQHTWRWAVELFVILLLIVVLLALSRLPTNPFAYMKF